jgi:hypothetical protein
MSDWSEIEVDIIIEDYFQMLHKEIKGNSYNKTAHRNRLLQLLNSRNHGSIEFKHQNISAILVNNGLPYIAGYKPRGNYQKLLEERVLAYLSKKEAKIEDDFNDFAYQKIEIKPQLIKFDSWVDTPPISTLLQESVEHYYKPVKRNYLELEQRNSAIGNAGEELVFEYEKWRLKNAGYSNLAKEVKWISKDQGDGAGYDILSKTITGTNIFIEVKSTKLGKDTPIFFSKIENDFSNENKKAFHLYRVFDLKRQPKMFSRNGSFKDMCAIEPVNFKGTF